MSEKPEVHTQLDFFFENDKDFRVVPANGVWGGVTPRGDVRADFFFEYQATPEKIVQAIEGEKLGREIDRTPKLKLVRTMMTGIVLNASQAKAVGEWFLEKAAQVELHAALQKPTATEPTKDGGQ